MILNLPVFLSIVFLVSSSLLIAWFYFMVFIAILFDGRINHRLNQIGEAGFELLVAPYMCLASWVKPRSDPAHTKPMAWYIVIMTLLTSLGWFWLYQNLSHVE